MSEIVWSEPDDGTFTPKGEVFTAEMMEATTRDIRAGRHFSMVRALVGVRHGYIPNLDELFRLRRLNLALADAFWRGCLHGGFWWSST